VAVGVDPILKLADVRTDVVAAFDDSAIAEGQLQTVN
jgi:hypothetical protein